MAVRNFWLTCEIDGAKSLLEGGPRAKGGGFNLEIRQRAEGRPLLVLRVVGSVEGDQLKLEVFPHHEATGGELVRIVKTSKR